MVDFRSNKTVDNDYILVIGLLHCQGFFCKYLQFSLQVQLFNILTQITYIANG